MVSRASFKPSRLIDYLAKLQDGGRLTFTKDEAVRALGFTSIAFNRSAERLMAKKQLIQPSRGFFVIVPAEYRLSGAPPVTWFIDQLMKFHGQPFYVGVLSAAAHLGAAHQAPQEFQVVTNGALRPIRAGRTKIHFLTKKLIERTPTQTIRTPYGDVPLSTTEATVFDLVKYVHRAGRLSNVATILIELSEKIDPKKLATVAKSCEENTVVQRVGYLLDTFTKLKLTKALHDWLETRQPTYTALRPNWKPPKNIRTKKNEKWRLLVNEVVEPDV